MTCDPIEMSPHQKATPSHPPSSTCAVMVLTPDAVVMEMESSSASTGGTVTMEISIVGPATVEGAERVQHHGQHRAALQHRNYRMLIVIGEISTSHHLDAARKQITQGKSREEWSEDLGLLTGGGLSVGDWKLSLQLKTSWCQP